MEVGTISIFVKSCRTSQKHAAMSTYACPVKIVLSCCLICKFTWQVADLRQALLFLSLSGMEVRMGKHTSNHVILRNECKQDNESNAYLCTAKRRMLRRQAYPMPGELVYPMLDCLAGATHSGQGGRAAGPMLLVSQFGRVDTPGFLPACLQYWRNAGAIFSSSF